MSFLKKIAIFTLLISLNIYASEEVPTQEEVAKLYVATFNRAPDADGLKYWTNDSGLKLSQIAKSFFEQAETKILYPTGVSNRDFIQSVYKNLFNREPDTSGWNYWENELDRGYFSKNSFIMAVINGAQNNDTSNDLDILSNKTTVGLSFADAGLESTEDAKSIMVGVDDTADSVTSAVDRFGLSSETEQIASIPQSLINLHNINYDEFLYKIEYTNRVLWNSFSENFFKQSVSVHAVVVHYDKEANIDNPTGLHLLFYYHADDWIFIKKVYILIDSVSYDTNIVVYDETDTHVGSSGTISESATLKITPDSTTNRKNIIDALSHATSVSIKLYGSNGSAKLDMSANNIEAIKNTILLYNEFILRD